jgi:hypothetical protein
VRLGFEGVATGPPEETPEAPEAIGVGGKAEPEEIGWGETGEEVITGPGPRVREWVREWVAAAVVWGIAVAIAKAKGGVSLSSGGRDRLKSQLKEGEKVDVEGI